MLGSYMAFPFILGAESGLTAIVVEGAGEDTFLSVARAFCRFARGPTSGVLPLTGLLNFWFA